MRVSLHPAFILHRYPFNETSLILDAFTQDYGRISLVARGARQPNSRFRGLLRPFTPLQLSWSGKTELMSLSAVEPNAGVHQLTGPALLSGFYLNELLVRLLPRSDPYVRLFTCYQQTLHALQHPEALEPSLRLFERELLLELGFGLSLHTEAITGESVHPERNYTFVLEQGLVETPRSTASQLVFQGKQLLAFHQGHLTEPDDLRVARQLMRLALNALLGNKPLRSRDFFRAVKIKRST